jgi:hypothetical protein
MGSYTLSQNIIINHIYKYCFMFIQACTRVDWHIFGSSDQITSYFQEYSDKTDSLAYLTAFINDRLPFFPYVNQVIFLHVKLTKRDSSSICYFRLFFVCVCNGVWTQGFQVAGWELYSLCHTSSSICYFVIWMCVETLKLQSKTCTVDREYSCKNHVKDWVWWLKPIILSI